MIKFKPVALTAHNKLSKPVQNSLQKQAIKKTCFNLSGEEKGFFTVTNSDGSIKIVRLLFPR